ncbi:MAG: hypothetical protein HYX84_00965 [Chloroflexi bacterium]|nr:hypothetical protein [Chloroflexota bacterium]
MPMVGGRPDPHQHLSHWQDVTAGLQLARVALLLNDIITIGLVTGTGLRTLR